MNKNIKYNTNHVNKDIFDSTCSIDEYISIPKNDKIILEKCKEYDNIDYQIILRKIFDNTGVYWVAEHPDLPGCITHGSTQEEALYNLRDAKEGWIYTKLCEEEFIPKPNIQKEIDECSGKILLRLPKELHYKLINKAKKEFESRNIIFNFKCFKPLSS